MSTAHPLSTPPAISSGPQPHIQSPRSSQDALSKSLIRLCHPCPGAPHGTGTQSKLLNRAGEAFVSHPHHYSPFLNLSSLCVEFFCVLETALVCFASWPLRTQLPLSGALPTRLPCGLSLDAASSRKPSLPSSKAGPGHCAANPIIALIPVSLSPLRPGNGSGHHWVSRPGPAHGTVLSTK